MPLTMINCTFSVRDDTRRQKRWVIGTYSQAEGVQFNGVSTSRTWTPAGQVDKHKTDGYKRILKAAIRPIIAGLRQRDNVGDPYR